jgi:hypothetical protein
MGGKTSRSSREGAKATKRGRPPLEPGPDGVVRLAGGNPQIPKGDGDLPVQAYIAAMPDWKKHIGRRMDELITEAVPGVFKAVRWNSPFYGSGPRTWFVSFHCLTRYIKVAFPNGMSLDPVPPGASKQPNVRYLDIYEGGFDAAQFTDWVKQASRLPGETF